MEEGKGVVVEGESEKGHSKRGKEYGRMRKTNMLP